MEIASLYLHNQRNAGHYQFQTDFNSTVIKYTPQALGIVDAYAEYLPHYEDEGVALVAVTKSATTDDLEIADKNRDFTFRGFSDKVTNSLNHFNSEVREAAKRMKVILDTYGNLAPKPNDEESGLISGLLADLRAKVPAEIVTLAVADWMAELERLNNVFIALEAGRNSEEANRSELRMKQVRLEVDAAYNKIVKRINALIIVNGETGYTEFVKVLNARIGRAKDAIAQSKAHKTEVPAPEA
ncbi:MAG: DUF6261 family protein [Paludibacter sp.]|jgi:hypothetical protein